MLGNYTVTYNTAAFTINKALLRVTTNNAAKVYGAPLPAFTASYSAFVNGDTPASLGGVLSFTTLATAASRVGSYAITPSGLTSTNYSIAYANGVLSVIKAPLTITAKNAAKTLNTPNPALTWTASGCVNGDATSVLMPSPTN